MKRIASNLRNKLSRGDSLTEGNRDQPPLTERQQSAKGPGADFPNLQKIRLTPKNKNQGEQAKNAGGGNKPPKPNGFTFTSLRENLKQKLVSQEGKKKTISVQKVQLKKAEERKEKYENKSGSSTSDEPVGMIIPPSLQDDYADDVVEKKLLVEKIKYYERENKFMSSEIHELKKVQKSEKQMLDEIVQQSSDIDFADSLAKFR